MPEEVKKDEKWGGQFDREKEQRQWTGKHTDEGEESQASKSLQATVWRLNVYLVNGSGKQLPLSLSPPLSHMHTLNTASPFPFLSSVSVIYSSVSS